MPKLYVLTIHSIYFHPCYMSISEIFFLLLFLCPGSLHVFFYFIFVQVFLAHRIKDIFYDFMIDRYLQIVCYFILHYCIKRLFASIETKKKKRKLLANQRYEPRCLKRKIWSKNLFDVVYKNINYVICMIEEGRC